jgi:outer membrane receptor for Fe3+-dicitrate
VEGFNLRRVSELGDRKQYQIKFSNRFAALDNLTDSDDINRDWENSKENIKSQTKGAFHCMI